MVKHMLESTLYDCSTCIYMPDMSRSAVYMRMPAAGFEILVPAQLHAC